MATVLERVRGYTPTPDYNPISPFLIESGIPLPPKLGPNGRAAIYPFAHMRPGDSFEITLSTYGGKPGATVERIMSAVGNCARGYAKRHNINATFATRKIDSATARIWRIA